MPYLRTVEVKLDSAHCIPHLTLFHHQCFQICLQHPFQTEHNFFTGVAVSISNLLLNVNKGDQTTNPCFCLSLWSNAKDVFYLLSDSLSCLVLKTLPVLSPPEIKTFHSVLIYSVLILLKFSTEIHLEPLNKFLKLIESKIQNST